MSNNSTKSTSKNPKLKSHLILFDASCPFCRRSVNHISSIDKRKIYLFAPLNGQTAKNLLDDTHSSLNSLILVEDYKTNPKVSIRSKAVFKIYSHLGGAYRLLGALAYIPPLFDPIYRLVAKNRHKLSGSDLVNVDQDRLLP